MKPFPIKVGQKVFVDSYYATRDRGKSGRYMFVQKIGRKFFYVGMTEDSRLWKRIELERYKSPSGDFPESDVYESESAFNAELKRKAQLSQIRRWIMEFGPHDEISVEAVDKIWGIISAETGDKFNI